MASRLGEFMRMNPPMYFGSIVKKNQKFLDEVYKILVPMDLITTKKAKVAVYQLKDVD